MLLDSHLKKYIYLFIYLAVPGLSCGMRDLLLRHAGFSLVVVWRLQGAWALSSLARDQTRVPCIGRRILYHWTTREVRRQSFFKNTNPNKLWPLSPLRFLSFCLTFFTIEESEFISSVSPILDLCF